MAHTTINVFKNRFTSAEGDTKKVGSIVNYLYVCILTSITILYPGCEQRRSLRILCYYPITTCNIHFFLIDV